MIIFSTIILALVSFLLVPRMFHPEVLTNLALGETILKNGVDMLDHFSIHNLKYDYPHWLTDVLTFKINEVFGYPGIYFGAIFIFFLLLVLVFFTIKKKSNTDVAIFLTLIIAPVLSKFAGFRPLGFSFIITLITYNLLSKYAETKNTKLFILIFICFILQVNIDVINLPILCLLFIPFIVKKGASKLRIFLPITLLSGLCTPQGLIILLYPIKFMLGRIEGTIDDYANLNPGQDKAMLIILFLFLIIMIVNKKQFKKENLILASLLLFISLYAKIYFVYFCIIGLIALSADFKIGDINKPFKTIILVGLILLNVAFRFDNKLDYIPDEVYPVQAVEYIKENYDDIKLFNYYNLGSYLMYEKIPLFIDSRADLYNPKFNKQKHDYYDDYVDISFDYDKLKDPTITHFLLANTSRMTKRMLLDEEYAVEYHDKKFTLFKKIAN